MTNKNVKKKYGYIMLITFIGIIFDQLTKILIRFSFNSTSCVKCLKDLVIRGGMYSGFKVVPERGIEIIPNFFYITNVENTGGAWGIFSGNVVALAIISLLVILILSYFVKSDGGLNKLSSTYYGFLFAGIIGNFIDRVVNGYVTDFLNFYIFGYDYPVFNIADMLIVLGIFLMFIDVVRGEFYAHKKRNRKC